MCDDLNDICNSYYRNNDDCGCGNQSYIVWAISCGVISLIFALLFGLVPMLSGYLNFGSIFFVIWWACAMVTLTMNNATCKDHTTSVAQGRYTYSYTSCQYSPFVNVCNGWFACWVGVFASLALFGGFWGGDMASA